MEFVSVLRRTRLAVLPAVQALLCVAAISAQFGAQAGAQAGTQSQVAPALPPGSVAKPARSATHSAKHPAHGRAAKAAALPVTTAVTHPPDPPPPDWPVNDKAKAASVDWNGRNLSIGAANSSLLQILADVSTATGVRVQGESADQRIYGKYGPAPARDVLSQLLEGSGYNVLMIGDQGEGTPRELVLTAKTHAAPQAPSANGQPAQNSDEEAPEEPEQPEQPDPMAHRPPGFPSMQPGGGRTPPYLQPGQQQQQQPQQNPQPPNQ